jgi:hypothetical protein
VDNDPTRQRTRRFAARTITEVFAPTVLTGVYLLASPLLVPGATWLHTAVAVVFTTVLPFAAVLWFKRLGAVSDHHVSVRSQRRGPFLVAAVSLLVGVRFLTQLDVPRELLLNLAGIFAGIVVCLVANLFWKLSVHVAVAAYVGLQLLGPFPVVGPAAALAVCAAVGWSRMELRQHTLAQVAAGLAVGVGLHLARVHLFS